MVQQLASLTREQWESHDKLSNNASERPHINSWIIWQTEDHLTSTLHFEKTQPHPAHLWGTVESALNVGVRSVINKTSTTEIDNSDVGSVWSD